MDDVLASRKISEAMELFKPAHGTGFEGRLLITRDDLEEPCCPHDGTLVYAVLRTSQTKHDTPRTVLSVYSSRPQHNAHLIVPSHFPKQDYHRGVLKKLLDSWEFRQPTRREMEDYELKHGYEYIWK